ncbi:MAG: hypothetical protein QM784_01245 [Polyangiaceae bacterium]
MVPAWYCGRDSKAWFDGEPSLQRALAEEQVRFELEDDCHRQRSSENRFAGEWALVTHQMTALGLAQLCLSHPDWSSRYAPVATRAAVKSFAKEMRDFGTRAWNEDALSSLSGSHGHAYLAYSALAISMARLVDAGFPVAVARKHDALIAAYERRLLASPTGLIETYPGEAYPTDVAAVAAAIAVHGRATKADHGRVLVHWATQLRKVQIDPKSGLVIQRMGMRNGKPHDAPRGSGTGLAAYFAGFADRASLVLLSDALLSHRTSFLRFGAIREYANGYDGGGDVDSGPVLFGVSVAATGFALAPARALRRNGDFESLYRTAELFGFRVERDARTRFATGGPIGNALMLAFLTSGPEVAP